MWTSHFLFCWGHLSPPEPPRLMRREGEVPSLWTLSSSRGQVSLEPRIPYRSGLPAFIPFIYCLFAPAKKSPGPTFCRHMGVSSLEREREREGGSVCVSMCACVCSYLYAHVSWVHVYLCMYCSPLQFCLETGVRY